MFARVCARTPRRLGTALFRLFYVRPSNTLLAELIHAMRNEALALSCGFRDPHDFDAVEDFVTFAEFQKLALAYDRVLPRLRDGDHHDVRVAFPAAQSLGMTISCEARGKPGDIVVDNPKDVVPTAVVRPGDHCVEINGVPLAPMTLDAFVDRVRAAQDRAPPGGAIVLGFHCKEDGATVDFGCAPNIDCFGGDDDDDFYRPNDDPPKPRSAPPGMKRTPAVGGR